MASSASLQCLALVTLAAILLQVVGVAVSFIYFSKVLDTVRKRVSVPAHTTTAPNEGRLTAGMGQETQFSGLWSSGVKECRQTCAFETFPRVMWRSKVPVLFSVDQETREQLRALLRRVNHHIH